MVVRAPAVYPRETDIGQMQDANELPYLLNQHRLRAFPQVDRTERTRPNPGRATVVGERRS
jgi:hypothetical protein